MMSKLVCLTLISTLACSTRGLFISQPRAMARPGAGCRSRPRAVGVGAGGGGQGVTCTSSREGPADAAATSRRSLLSTGLAAATAAIAAPGAASAVASLDGYAPELAVTAAEAGRQFFPPLTPPLSNRATYRYELGRNAWALEQLLVFSNVSATIRTIVVKLEDGTLWVNGPQWPTGEFCKLLDELGPVAHVVVPCTALEHKAPVQAFLKKYPNVKSVWTVPGQYSVFGSIGLDVASSKMPYKVDGVFPVGAPKPSDPLPPWASEFDYRTLYVSLPENAGPVSEAIFLHKPSKTLITTDAVVYVPDSPPPIFETYFDKATVGAEGFWPKSVLQAVFLPLRQGSEPGDVGAWPGYGAVQGRLLRAPILRAFADARAPGAVRSWVDDVSKMGEFDRIITGHFASPIKATPADFRAAFAYLDGPAADPPIVCEDWSLLDGLNDVIATNKLGAPVEPGFDFKAGCKKVS